MNDTDLSMVQNDLNNPNSPFYLNKPTVMDIINNYQNAATNTKKSPASSASNIETIPKTNFFNNKAPDIKGVQPYDSFTIMHNDKANMNKNNAMHTLLSTAIVGLSFGFLSGKLIKLPKINFAKLKPQKFKLPKMNFHNPFKNFNTRVITEKFGQLKNKIGSLFKKK